MATVRGLSNKSNALAKESPYCWRRIFPLSQEPEEGKRDAWPARGDQDVGAYGRKASGVCGPAVTPFRSGPVAGSLRP